MRISLTLLLLAVVLASAAAQQKQGITVQYTNSSHIILRVNQESSVQAVLEAFCSGARFKCEIVPQATQTKVVPMTVSGSWDEIVGKVLEGTGLSYVGFPSSGSSEGRLLVQLSSGPDAPRPAMAAMTPPPQPAPEPEPLANMTPATQPDANSSSSTGPASQSPEASPAPEPPAGMAFTPFVGPDGKPVVVPISPSTSYAPFVDQNGQPIEIQTNGPRPQYLPYPDQNGNLIPMPPPAPAGTVTPNPFPETPH